MTSSDPGENLGGDLREAAVREVLRGRGCPPHVVQGGARGLVEGWRRFVSEVQAGYEMGLDEYCNDLDIRNLIEAAGLAAQVADEDERFRAALTHTETAVWFSDFADAFWVRGYPANAPDELLADLKARMGA